MVTSPATRLQILDVQRVMIPLTIPEAVLDERLDIIKASLATITGA
jgi:4-aminobutyrate aminotransferase-like enzyme